MLHPKRILSPFPHYLHDMPRNARCVLPGTPYHITQRGNDRQRVFFLNSDRELYLHLLHRNLAYTHTRLLAYALMTNHIHAVVVPQRADSLALLYRRVHGPYAQYLNTRRNHSGHLWQGRFYSCPLSFSHLATALNYVEHNPCRAGIVQRPEDYRWSSAAVHLAGVADRFHVLDTEFFERAGGATSWHEMSATPLAADTLEEIRACTFGCRPFGEDDFVTDLETRFGRSWHPRTRTKTASR